MAEKGHYKKLAGWESKERREPSSRAREKEDAKTAAGEEIPDYKKKVKKKRPVVRADHRHVYEEVLVRTTDGKTGERSYSIEGYCQICGKKDQRYKPTAIGFWKEDRLWKSRIVGGRKVYSERSEEEILEICRGMKIVEMTEP